jgi:DNA-binding transcriptional LysR family regulator
VDWDKLRVFHAAAEAGSFTHAGESLGLSQSAVSRQVSALEADLQVPLFHRHARGLILTEQGETLYRTVRDVVMKLDATRSRLSDSRERPRGELRVTTTVGIGTNWLTPRLGDFLELYPDIKLTVLLSDDELDLSMREADVAIRVREPVQADLIRRRLFTMHFHAYASPSYLKRFGEPKTLADLDNHRILTYGSRAQNYLGNINSLHFAGRDPKDPRPSTLTVNNISALRRAVENGVGIAVLPDYLALSDTGLVRILPQADMPENECYLVFAEELKDVARVRVFRDFLVANAQRWEF